MDQKVPQPQPVKTPIETDLYQEYYTSQKAVSRPNRRTHNTGQTVDI